MTRRDSVHMYSLMRAGAQQALFEGNMQDLTLDPFPLCPSVYET